MAATSQKEDADSGTIQDPEILTFLHDMIRKSPPCQLTDVVANAKKLTQSKLPPDLIARACCDHNEKSLLVLPLGKDGKVGVISDAGRRSNRAAPVVSYQDPRDEGSIFRINHERQECVELCAQQEGNDLASQITDIGQSLAAPFRLAMEEQLCKYAAEHYPPNNGLGSFFVYSAKGKEVEGFALQVVISSRRSRPRGYWAGQWGSIWYVELTPGQAKPAQLRGRIEFITHYSEDGNVHFRRKIDKRGEVTETSDPEKFALQAVSIITAAEESFHEQIEDTCATFGAGPLKAMRRVLPLSMERFDWRPSRHALIRDMRGATKTDPLGTGPVAIA